jgi:hypothetical protein
MIQAISLAITVVLTFAGYLARVSASKNVVIDTDRCAKEWILLKLSDKFGVSERGSSLF